MDPKIPEWFLSFSDPLISAQLRKLRQLKSPQPKKVKRKGEKSRSNINMAIDILHRAQMNRGVVD